MNILVLTKAKIITMIVAAIPVLELRASIPLAMLKYNMPQLEALLYSVLGSVIPVFPILFGLEYLEPILRKSKKISVLLDKIFAHTRAKSEMIKELELIGLILFIGVPLPGTGVWTGTLAAYLFGLPKLQTFFAALVGTTMAGLIMVFLSSYIDIIIKYFFLFVAIALLIYILMRLFKKRSKK